MTRSPARRALCALVLLAAHALGAPGAATGQPAKPEYLPYAEFASEDTPAANALKRGYNATVLRYNQALYDYHLVLDQHDQLVDLYGSGTASAADRQKARAQATALRARLGALRREVMSRAAAVDRAARRAAAAGVDLRP